MTPETKELKIFQFNWNEQGEKEWVCAYTNLHAIQTYLWITDVNIMDFDVTDEIAEVPKEKWQEYSINNSEYDENDPEDWKEKTFEEYMKTATVADIIAGTVYE